MTTNQSDPGFRNDALNPALAADPGVFTYSYDEIPSYSGRLLEDDLDSLNRIPCSPDSIELGYLRAAITAQAMNPNEDHPQPNAIVEAPPND